MLMSACNERAGLFLIVLLQCACSTEVPPTPKLGPPPGTYQVLAEDGVIRIPFDIFRGDIRMRAEIAGQPVKLLLDNGSLWDQLLLIGSPRVSALGLEYGDPIEVGGSGEGNPLMAEVASNVSIRFPGVEFAEQTTIVMPESPEQTDFWEGSDGQISAAFFKHFVVEIDFDRSVIILHDPDTFEYRGDGRALAMHVGSAQLQHPELASAFTIPATISMKGSQDVTIDLMLDLGGLNPLHLTLGTPSGIRLPETTIEDVLGVGIQGEYRGYFGRVARISLGGYAVEDVLAAFAPNRDGAARHDDHIIGLPLLSRFNLVFDYHRQILYIAPNGRFTVPSEYDMTGMTLGRAATGALIVKRVLPDSPASEAGLLEGDTIVQVDGRDSSHLDQWDLDPVFRQAGRTVRVRMRRENKEWDTTFILRRLI